MKKTKGFSVIEILVTVLLLSIVSLSYIKSQADINRHQKESLLHLESTKQMLHWGEVFSTRIKHTPVNFIETKSYIEQFTYENCSESPNNIITEEFNNHFCHIAKQNQNLLFVINECNENNLCLEYYGNRFNYLPENNCDENISCFNQILWGLEEKNNEIIFLTLE